MRAARPLAVLLLCAFAVNVDTTIVNVALPTLTEELGATTRDLQWVVDAYTLVFAALVLAAGALGDRFGRKELLLVGLVIYAGGNAAAALVDSSSALIACRVVMGVGAAVIFPATLSTIVHLYPDRGGRAKAIGLWGATTGIAVALGPIVGGALLEASGWQAAFWIKLPIAALAFVLALRLVPTSRDPARPPVDRVGLVISTLGVLALVYTVIEAPEHGWLAARTLAGFGLAAALLGAFIAFEARLAAPLLDVRLFRNLRFSAASASVLLVFFALFGFIFLITQYFQVLRDTARSRPGSACSRWRSRPAPRACSARSSRSGSATRRWSRPGSPAPVRCSPGPRRSTTRPPTSRSRRRWSFFGIGMGFTTAPSTESIMGAVPEANAGVGSGVNDTARELGGTLGVAVIGSVFASLYAGAFADAPAAVPAAAEDSIGAAFAIAGELGGTGGAALTELASAGFYDGLEAGCLVASGVCLVGCVAAATLLPSRPPAEAARPAGDPALAEG